MDGSLFRTCRVYDPAIDATPIRDANGQKVPLTNAAGEPLVDRFGEPMFKTVSDRNAFLADRDVKHLVYLPGAEPVWFDLRPITRQQWREWVSAADTVKEQFRRAFESACVKVSGLRDRTGARLQDITLERNGSLDLVTSKSLDQLWATGITDADMIEIGAVAHARADVPFGGDVSYLLPPSSPAASRKMSSPLRPADATATSSPGSAEAPSGGPGTKPSAEPSAAPGAVPVGPPASSTTPS